VRNTRHFRSLKQQTVVAEIAHLHHATTQAIASAWNDREYWGFGKNDRSEVAEEMKK
jgi:hypothetical protein